MTLAFGRLMSAPYKGPPLLDIRHDWLLHFLTVPLGYMNPFANPLLLKKGGDIDPVLVAANNLPSDLALRRVTKNTAKDYIRDGNALIEWELRRAGGTGPFPQLLSARHDTCLLIICRIATGFFLQICLYLVEIRSYSCLLYTSPSPRDS